jgi:hypothetical protein
MFLDRTTAEQNLTFRSRTNRNPGSPNHHFGRQLSQLSYGLSYGFKRSMIYELQLSELDWFAESEILGRLDLLA